MRIDPPGFPMRSVLPVVLALTLVGLTGCRGGMRAMTAPKWPTFGAAKSKGIDAPALASVPSTAPANDAPVPKPSAAATPYPTSSTPAGYVVSDPSSPGAASGVIQAAAADPQAVTYGITPPPDPVAAQPTPPAPVAGGPAPAGISPQVGPYASLPAPPAPSETPTAPGLPAGALPLPAAAAVAGDRADGALAPIDPPPASAFPSTAGYEPTPRVADARPLAEPQAPPPMVPVAADPASLPAGGVPARYASQGSRFGGPDASPLPAEAPAALAPAFAPAIAPAAGGDVPAVPGTLPPAQPDGLTSPPVRRPDPVFRPGGTSSYRPAEQIFAEEAPTPPSSVRTASFESIDPPPSAGSPVVR